ncbi:MAG: hypothetical protein DRI73_00340 [Bacteroidetes bacterium]|nr:MAG: hypothetical protein DRI73_00340 [Bacteroidota bacterium]
MIFGSCTQDKIEYEVAENPWDESLGNHRAVLKIDKAANAVILDINWRRHDRNPERKQFIIIHKESGDTIKNIQRIKVDNEGCQLVFGPVGKTGNYYFYYLPYIVQKEYGFYNKGYLRPENKPDENWVKKNGLSNVGKIKNLPKSTPVGFQSRTEFDSFFPMEVIALQSEKDSLVNIHKNDFLVFPEDRKFPIRMLDEIPQKWIQCGSTNKFTGEALKNEYYTFQLGVFAAQKDLTNLKVEFSSLKNSDFEIPVSNLSCFNTGGIGPYGKSFVKRVDVGQGNVQPLWIGVDIPENAKSGNYIGEVTLSAENTEPQIININIKIKNKYLDDRGDSEAWRHSRLRWLNSTLGIDNQPTKPFQAISVLGENSYGFTKKEMTMSENGFPGSFNVKGTEILNRPISFNVETGKGFEKFTEPQNVQLLKNEPGVMSGSWESYSEHLEIKGVGTIEADAYINYKLKLKALKAFKVKDIRLEIPLRSQVAKYMMGMDLPGTTVPQKHNAKWNGPHDSFWIGNTSAGLWCELRGSDYHGPLLNLYRPGYPDSWFNNNKGGFKIESSQDEVNAVIFSGSRNLKKGEELEFEWSFLITPVKDINYESQFTDRYYHNGGNPLPSDEDLKSGVKIVNLHHANNFNPHINYPFVAIDSMKWFVDKMHEKGQKVKIYYTIRELTNYTTEIWALRSLGDEILGNGRGGGYPWLREHLVSGYRPQWYQWFPDKSADASIVNAPGDSRWYNYYIAGLEWLIKNVDIDGLYLDDVSYDRRTVKRIRKVLDNTKPGCILDLHSNTGFSKGPATQYTEYFPYLDKLWFGESFQYDEMSPANWLVEVSGIPFGLMGDMLHGGGNPWRGMVYGMTVRHSWTTEGVTCDPRAIWKIWDSFGIAGSKMVGYWDDKPIVKTGNKNVMATAYVKENKILISLASWAEKPVKVKLDIDWEATGLDKSKVRITTPEIENFQPGRIFKLDEEIPVEPGRGWLILVESG